MLFEDGASEGLGRDVGKISAVGYFTRVIARACPNKSLEIMTKNYPYSIGLL